MVCGPPPPSSESRSSNVSLTTTACPAAKPRAQMSERRPPTVDMEEPYRPSLGAQLLLL